MSTAQLSSPGDAVAAAATAAAAHPSTAPHIRAVNPLIPTTLAVLCSLAALAVYDRQVVRPGQRLGIVDVGEVYRQREAAFTRLLTDAGNASGPQADQARAQALAGAQQFARRLPHALQALAQDCGCLVLLKSAVAGSPPQAQDLTALLHQKLEQP